MSKKRVVKPEVSEFKNTFMRGPRIVLAHEGSDWRNGEPVHTTSIDVADIYVAMALLSAAQKAVRFHLEQAEATVAMLKMRLNDE